MSRHYEYLNNRFTIITGTDHALGRFIQITDNEFTDDPSGEGYILDISDLFGIETNFTGIPPMRGSFEDGLAIIEKLKQEHNL